MMFAELSAAQRQVLETIWRLGPIARHEIARMTGFTGASITRLTRDLDQLGLVADRVMREGSRGQPARPLTLSGGGAYALGVNFSHSYMDIGLVNLVGTMVASERVALADADAMTIAELARDGLERLRTKSRVPLKRIAGAGFSVPGDFGEHHRFAAHAFFPKLAGQDLRAVFASIMPVPVQVENDAASAALGERVLGAGIDLDTFMLVHIGHGVGSGWVLDGRLYRGAHDNAGMIGVNFPMDRPRPSGQDLFGMLAQAGLAIGDFNDLESLPLDHPAVQDWLARAGAQLAEGLYQITRTLDPQAVILGGRLPPGFLSALFAHMPLEARLLRDTHLPSPRVLQSTLGPHAGVIGAAAVCFFRAFFQER